MSRQSYFDKLRYGLTPERRAELLAEQDGGCGICRGPLDGKRRGHVDHDHESGAVRGLLCHRCNTAIGLLREDPNTLRAAIAYLERHHDHSAPLLLKGSGSPGNPPTSA